MQNREPIDNCVCVKFTEPDSAALVADSVVNVGALYGLAATAIAKAGTGLIVVESRNCIATKADATEVLVAGDALYLAIDGVDIGKVAKDPSEFASGITSKRIVYALEAAGNGVASLRCALQNDALVDGGSDTQS